MTRGMALLLGLMVLAITLFVAYVLVPRQGDYFNPALSRNDYPCSLSSSINAGPLDPFFDEWFSKPLRDVGEPSLFRSSPPRETTTIRFTFLPAFVEPVIVRVDDLYGERPQLTAYRVLGQVRPAPDRNLHRGLRPEEARGLRDFIATSRVLEEQPDSCLSGLDGAVYLIEANGPGGYRFINRWGVGDGSVYELGNLMFALTGWPNGPQGPDLDHLPPYSGPARAYP